MKSWIKNTLVICSLSSCLVACKKENAEDNSSEKTIIELVQQFWTIQNIEDINYEGTSTTVKDRDKLTLSPTDYMEFRNDGKVYRKIQDDLDTISYDLKTDNLIELGSEIFSIEVINENSFKLLYEERIDTPYFDNVIELRR